MHVASHILKIQKALLGQWEAKEESIFKSNKKPEGVQKDLPDAQKVMLSRMRTINQEKQLGFSKQDDSSLFKGIDLEGRMETSKTKDEEGKTEEGSASFKFFFTVEKFQIVLLDSPEINPNQDPFL